MAVEGVWLSDLKSHYLENPTTGLKIRSFIYCVKKTLLVHELFPEKSFKTSSDLPLLSESQSLGADCLRDNISKGMCLSTKRSLKHCFGNDVLCSYWSKILVLC